MGEPKLAANHWGSMPSMTTTQNDLFLRRPDLESVLLDALEVSVDEALCSNAAIGGASRRPNY